MQYGNKILSMSQVMKWSQRDDIHQLFVITLMYVYRQPYSEKHRKTVGMFITEFSDVWSDILTLYSNTKLWFSVISTSMLMIPIHHTPPHPCSLIRFSSGNWSSTWPSEHTFGSFTRHIRLAHQMLFWMTIVAIQWRECYFITPAACSKPCSKNRTSRK